ncbi:unnamed protein product [Symbiodinium sp. KB8]|nr:unnamed protein product [Symbiodinium sp. KB8]
MLTGAVGLMAILLKGCGDAVYDTLEEAQAAVCGGSQCKDFCDCCVAGNFGNISRVKGSAIREVTEEKSRQNSNFGYCGYQFDTKPGSELGYPCRQDVGAVEEWCGDVTTTTGA